MDSARITACLLFALSLLLAQSASALDSIAPGAIDVEPTFESLGIRWPVTGDDDLDAICTVRYRALGSTSWLPALDALRSHTGVGTENRFAGSVFHLAPDTSYEVELALADPDGGGSTQIVMATTRSRLVASSTPTEFWVAPGAGGGTGTMGDPFLGLQEAADNAVPGALFHVVAGSYAGFRLSMSGAAGSPIVFRGPVDPNFVDGESGWAMVDGAATSSSVLVLGGSGAISHVVVEQFVVQNGSFGVNAKRCTDCALRRSLIRDVDNGFISGGAVVDVAARHEISDNTFIGREVWPGAMAGGANNGIYLGGTAHTIARNRIEFFGDGILHAPSGVPVDGSDIYGNDISYIVDDAVALVESDANVRVWRNRISNAGTGISMNAIRGGPVYVFRNEIFNVFGSPFNLIGDSVGIRLFHNTAVKLENAVNFYSGDRLNLLARNNLLLGTLYVFNEAYASASQEDWDHDAIGTTDVARFINWRNVRYDDLPMFVSGTGQESNGVLVGFVDLVDGALPAAYADGPEPGSWDLRLAGAALAIDAGASLANVNDGFVADTIPDAGAFEVGEGLPQYGPGATSRAVPLLTPLLAMALAALLGIVGAIGLRVEVRRA